MTILLKPILPAVPSRRPPTAAAARHTKPGLPPAEKSKAEKAATEAAENGWRWWTRRSTRGAWEFASEEFKTQIDRRDWVKLIGDARKPLGKVKSRQADSQLFEESSSEDGPVQQFTARRDRLRERQKAAEMLTLTPDRKNAWRVSAYRIDEETRTDGILGDSRPRHPLTPHTEGPPEMSPDTQDVQ